MAYEMMWRKRCYSDDLPDELPKLLEATNRAPTWRKIAICLLKNDMKLKGLGFTEETYNKNLIRVLKKSIDLSEQMDFFD